MDTITTRPAWTTTEFWLTVIPTILFLTKAFLGESAGNGVDVQALSVIAAGIAAGAYAISRAITKRAVVAAQAMLMANRSDLTYRREADLQHRMAAQPSSYDIDGVLDSLETRLAALEERMPAAAPPASRAARVARSKQ